LAALGTATMSFTTWRLGQVLLSDLLFVAAALVIVVKLLTGNDGDLAPPEQRKSSPLILAGALLLLTAGTLSSLRSWTPVESITVVLRFAWITLVWFWIMRTVCRDRDDLKLLLRAWKFAALATSCAAVLGMLGVAFLSTHLGDRQVGLNGHPNHLAGQVSAAFILFLLAVPRAEHTAGRRMRVGWLIALGVTAVAVFSSGSISGLAGILAAMCVVGVAYAMTHSGQTVRRRRSPLAPALALIAVGIGAFVLFTSDLPVIDRLTKFREGDSGVVTSVDSRGERNAIVTERFDRYLLVGMGFDLSSGTAFIDPNNPAQRDYGVHNMHLRMLYQAGLPAVIGAMVILVTAGRQLKALLRRSDPELYAIVLALIGCFVAVNVLSLFQPVAFDRFFWMPVALTGCVWSIRRRELQVAASAGQPAFALSGARGSGSG
jgi:O-Antigen ligase